MARQGRPSAQGARAAGAAVMCTPMRIRIRILGLELVPGAEIVPLGVPKATHSDRPAPPEPFVTPRNNKSDTHAAIGAGALSRLKHGFESRWGHHQTYRN